MPDSGSAFWSALVGGTTAGSLEGEYKRRFLAGLLLALIPLSAVLGIFVLPQWLAPLAPEQTSTFQAAGGFTIGLLLAFVVNRLGYYRTAASLTVLAVLAATFWASFDHAQMVSFVLIAVVIATALFPLRGAVLVGVLGMLAAPALLLNPSHGIADVVLPGCVNATIVALLSVVRYHHMMLDRKQRASIERSERWFSTTLHSIGDGVLTVDTEGYITFMNPVASRLTGWSLEEARGLPIDEVFDIVHEHTGEPVENPVRKVLREGIVVGLANHTLLVSRDGTRHPIADSGAPILDASGALYGVVLVFRDLGQERALTERLRRAERLESLGQLAGGVAHDFNNLLTVIGSAAQFAMNATEEDAPVRTDLHSLIKATERAVSLTRQLLAFSRRQVMQPRVVRIDRAIREAEQLLSRLLREDVRIVSDIAPDTGCVLIDPTQFEQVLVNLAINANDAMPMGGTLTIAASRTELQDHPELPPGTYACIQVQDTGCGMDAATSARIFEPFFTTKDGGRGTGLGLSTVHGIVRQSGGDVSVESTPGEGTTFSVLLPTTNLSEDAPRESAVEEPLTRSHTVKTIYLVEDETMVRMLGVRILERLGYRVCAFSNGADLLRHYDAAPEVVDLLVTDVVMPGMSGPQVAEALRARIPRLPVVFVSGYANEVVAREGVTGSESVFLEKPFTPRALAETIRGRFEARERATAQD